jgi:hypothetical protein
MPDELQQESENLRALFSALPLLEPQRSAWPRLQSQVGAGRRRRFRGARWLALAASLALLALAPGWLSAPIDQQPAVEHVASSPASANESPALDALMHESSQLERWIAHGQSRAVDSGSNASLEAGIDARLRQIDALLARTDLEPRAQLPLWQERVLRLRQLTQIETTQMLLAARGEPDTGLPVLSL